MAAGNRMIARGGRWLMIGEIQSQTLIEVDGGELIYAPSVDTGKTPDLNAHSGILDLSRANTPPRFDDVILGPDIDVFGDFATGDTPTGLSVSIDLSEDFPR